MSRCRSWPDWMLRFVLERPWMRSLHAEAWIEWHQRAVVEALDDEENEAHVTCAPKGIQ